MVITTQIGRWSQIRADRGSGMATRCKAADRRNNRGGHSCQGPFAGSGGRYTRDPGCGWHTASSDATPEPCGSALLLNGLGQQTSRRGDQTQDSTRKAPGPGGLGAFRGPPNAEERGRKCDPRTRSVKRPLRFPLDPTAMGCQSCHAVGRVAASGRELFRELACGRPRRLPR
jgi:hypothetical protein